MQHTTPEQAHFNLIISHLKAHSQAKVTTTGFPNTSAQNGSQLLVTHSSTSDIYTVFYYTLEDVIISS